MHGEPGDFPLKLILNARPLVETKVTERFHPDEIYFKRDPSHKIRNKEQLIQKQITGNSSSSLPLIVRNVGNIDKMHLKTTTCATADVWVEIACITNTSGWL